MHQRQTEPSKRPVRLDRQRYCTQLASRLSELIVFVGNHAAEIIYEADSTQSMTSRFWYMYIHPTGRMRNVMPLITQQTMPREAYILLSWLAKCYGLWKGPS